VIIYIKIQYFIKNATYINAILLDDIRKENLIWKIAAERKGHCWK